MSLSIFINEIDNNESVLESYNYFGIEHEVALESAMDTIKEKVRGMIKKIIDWIVRFINWVKNIFKKKIKEVDEKINNHNSNNVGIKHSTDNNENPTDKKIQEHKRIESNPSKQLLLTAPKRATVNSELYKIFIEASDTLHTNAPKVMAYVNSILTATAPFNKNTSYSDRYYRSNGAVILVRNTMWALEDVLHDDTDKKREPFNKTYFEAVSNKLIQSVEFLNNETKTLSNYIMTDEKAKALGTYDDDDAVAVSNESNYKLQAAMNNYHLLIKAFTKTQHLGMFLLNNIKYE